MRKHMNKDLLGLRHCTKEDILTILERGAVMKSVIASGRSLDRLQGKRILNLFFENSTRTRVSFELAIKNVGAGEVTMSALGSSVAKGETLLDTGLNLEAMGIDGVVIRHSASGAPHLLAKTLQIPVINAGDGMDEHPTQALLDMLTMKEYKGGFDGLKVTIAGDALHSRVVRSNIWGLQKLGAKVTVCAPVTLIPAGLSTLGITVTTDIKEAVKDADVVMALRIQLERQKAALFPSLSSYAVNFGIDEKIMSLAKKDAILMHPGPVNRGVELSSTVMDGSKSVILEQVTNGVAVRMAVLDLLLTGGSKN